jgi:predicted RNA-binding Zn-ribbon protein involved in translation (DUF1610 family)
MKNKYQEVFKRLKNDIERGNCDYNVEPYLNVIQELVDKETPMKVIYENDLVDENVIVNTWVYCPTCKEEIPYELWENLNYCPNCGQHLDWRDKDE